MERPHFFTSIQTAFQVHPVVALLGPRQCGKTTLAKMYAQESSATHHFDLEDPRDLARLQTPLLTLESLTGLIIIDEIQRVPELFPILRVLVDQHVPERRFLILGSASRDLIRQSSESLAGRIAHLELTPFTLRETQNASQLWLRGGFPKSYLADSEAQSFHWIKQYVSTFLERDIPTLGFNIPPQSLRRFWAMLAHYHGQIFNASEIGKSLGLSHPTVRRYLDILTGVFMIRQLHPWFESSLKKRQVKSPKIYFRDSGVFHYLMGIEHQNALMGHPKLGASWEGFILEEVIRVMGADAEDCYFWNVHGGSELDLLIVRQGKRLGFEIKYTDAPKLTQSMRIAMESLHLDQLTLLCPKISPFPLAANIWARSMEDLIQQTSLR